MAPKGQKLLDLNSCTVRQLCAKTGISKEAATQIVNYRRSHSSATESSDAKTEVEQRSRGQSRAKEEQNTHQLMTGTGNPGSIKVRQSDSTRSATCKMLPCCLLTTPVITNTITGSENKALLLERCHGQKEKQQQKTVKGKTRKANKSSQRKSRTRKTKAAQSTVLHPTGQLEEIWNESIRQAAYDMPADEKQWSQDSRKMSQKAPIKKRLGKQKVAQLSKQHVLTEDEARTDYRGSREETKCTDLDRYQVHHSTHPNDLEGAASYHFHGRLEGEKVWLQDKLCTLTNEKRSTEASRYLEDHGAQTDCMEGTSFHFLEKMGEAFSEQEKQHNLTKDGDETCYRESHEERNTDTGKCLMEHDTQVNCMEGTSTQVLEKLRGANYCQPEKQHTLGSVLSKTSCMRSQEEKRHTEMSPMDYITLTDGMEGMSSRHHKKVRGIKARQQEIEYSGPGTGPRGLQEERKRKRNRSTVNNATQADCLESASLHFHKQDLGFEKSAQADFSSDIHPTVVYETCVQDQQPKFQQAVSQQTEKETLVEQMTLSTQTPKPRNALLQTHKRASKEASQDLRFSEVASPDTVLQPEISSQQTQDAAQLTLERFPSMVEDHSQARARNMHKSRSRSRSRSKKKAHKEYRPPEEMQRNQHAGQQEDESYNRGEGRQANRSESRYKDRRERRRKELRRHPGRQKREFCVLL